MDAWDKAAVIEWFKAHRAEEIVIRMQGAQVRLQGRTRGVEQLDACSTEIAETELAMPQQDVETILTFHDTTLGVQLIAYRPGGREVAVSLPVSIPYEALRLATAEELAKAAGKEGEGGEPEFSPYELLH